MSGPGESGVSIPFIPWGFGPPSEAGMLGFFALIEHTLKILHSVLASQLQSDRKKQQESTEVSHDDKWIGKLFYA